ncbi:DUF481 domain-containing protein [Ferrimonas senticii]|uniref:DUF481 domain-containing protein n=1 Tax=Ferrimonas senticii TaxID=394566 RepID=UPI00040A9C2A|nr:DUF481 domain-containing protein [Ferrimonas senticii]
MKRILPITLALLPTLALAENSAEAELGATITSGNTESTSILAKFNGKHIRGDWTNSYKLEALYSEDDNERSAEKYFAEAKTDYPATGRHYFFALVNGEIDKFSGYDYVVNGVAGYGNRLIDTEVRKLSFEIGPGYAYKKVDTDITPDGEDENDLILHVKGEYLWQFSDNAEFKQVLGSDIAFDGATISFSETAVVANLVDSLAMKVSYNVKHNSDPVGDTKSTDTILAATLLYKF